MLFFAAFADRDVYLDVALWMVSFSYLGALVWAFRVLFRRPWSVVHRGPGDVESATWRVVGWREAHRVMVEAAESIERGGTAQVTPPTAGWVS